MRTTPLATPLAALLAALLAAPAAAGDGPLAAEVRALLATRYATAAVPDRIRAEMAAWLVMQAEARGIEWTPEYARRVAFGDE